MIFNSFLFYYRKSSSLGWGNFFIIKIIIKRFIKDMNYKYKDRD